MEAQKDQLDRDIKNAFLKMKQLETASPKCPVEETLAAYAEGHLSQDELEGIEEHMVSCGRCADAVLELYRSLQSDGSETAAAVAGETLHKIKRLMKSEDRQSFWSRFVSRLAIPGPKPAWAMASVCLIVVAYAIHYYQPADGPTMFAPPTGSIRLIAGMPSDIVTRGAEPIYEGVELKDGGILRSGDRFRIEFNLERDGFAYLLLVGSTGTPMLLYPSDTDSPAVKLRSHTTLSLPGDSRWYRLDSSTGDEMIYLITSAVALEDIHRKTPQLNTSQTSSIAKAFPATNIQAFRVKHE